MSSLRRLISRERISKLLVYLLIAPLFTIFQGVAGPIENANAALYSFTNHTFTNCAKTGKNGPTKSECRSAYTTSWDENNSYFDVTDGIQKWTVPTSGTYTIKVYGARGGNSTGGLGAVLQGTFSLTEGEIINLVIGQMGSTGTYVSGGGGGTFVFRNSTDSYPLIAAGGGGGGGYSAGGGPTGQNGTTSNNGTNGTGLSIGGGTSGNGGTVSGRSEYALSGAGWLTNGHTAHYSCENGYGVSAKAPRNLSTGGTSNGSLGGEGGFGGGGASGVMCGAIGGGGGGGYSGGGSGGGGSYTYGGGGGGGSYNAGSDQVNTGTNNTHGKVEISLAGISITTPTGASLTGTYNSNFSISAPTVSGATGQVTYSLSGSGSLPAGLTLNSDGSISGTPTSPGTYSSIRITASDDGTNTTAQTDNFTITVNKITPTLSISSASATYNSATTITATTSVAGSVTFKVGGSSITGCSSVATSGSGTISATCSWTPESAGTNSLSADFVPTDSTYYSSLTGAGSTSVSVTATTPGAPTNVAATSYENAQSVVSWTAPTSTGGAAITGYTVTSNPAVTAPASCTNTSNLTCTFSGLTNGTLYTFTVTASNGTATSSSSSASEAITPNTGDGLNWYSKRETGASSSLSRSSVTSTYTSCGKSTTINYAWGSGATTCLSSYTDGFTNYWEGYIVAPYSGSVTFYNTADDGFYLTIGSTNVISNWVDQGDATYNSSGSITLVKGQAYLIKIWHHENAGGAVAKLFWAYTGQSTTVVPQHYLYSTNPVGATVPDAPTSVSGTAGNAQVVLTWSEPSSNGGAPISGYKVEYSSNSGSSWSTATSNTGSTSTSYTVTGLTNLITYVFKVSAINSVGTGSASSNSSSVTPGAQAPTISSQPSGATKTAGQAITFSVTASAGDSGTLSYQWKKDGTNIGTNSSSYSISSITSGDAGVYTVVVTNTKNSTTNTTTSSSATLTVVGAPSAPQNVAFTNSGVSAGSLKLTWDAPSSNGGGTITGYEYRYSLNAEESWSVWTSSDTRTVTITGLGNQKSYKAQVRAKNAYGTSASAATSAAVSTTGDLAVLLAAPTNVAVTNGDSTNGGKLNITFTDATPSNSVSIATSYQYTTDNGSSWKTATVSTGVMTISAVSASTASLVNGTSYSIRIRVVNAAGPGTASSAVTGTPSKIPGVPTSLSLSQNGSTGLTLSFTAPSDTGGLSLTYEYMYRSSSGSWPTSWTAASSTSISITGVTNGTYEAKVRAVNATGNSAESAAVTATVVAATGPTITSQPTNKDLTVGQSSSNTLSVSATAGNGETLSYQWQYYNGSSWVSADGTSTASTYTVPVTSAFSNRKYRVIVTGSKTGSSAGTSAKIDAMGGSSSSIRCTAPNTSTSYYGQRFTAGTADTIKEMQVQFASYTTSASLAGSKIYFHTHSNALNRFYTTSANDQKIGELAFVSMGSDYKAIYRGSVALSSTGSYWWSMYTPSTSRITFCENNVAETNTDGWSNFKNGASWQWFLHTAIGNFNWGNHPSVKIFTSTSTVTTTADTTSSEVTVNVNAAPTIATSTVPGATKGSAYSTALQVTTNTGTGPFTWALANGSSLPAGLSLSSAGVISGTPTALQAGAAASGSGSGALKNGDFSANFVNTPAANAASDGWYRFATRGGPTVINTVGKNLQFSYGFPACSSQSTVAMSEVRQTVLIPTAGTVTFKVTVTNNIWNRIGFGYGNPCYDPYQVTMRSSGGASADTTRRIPTSTTGNYVTENVELSLTTTSANELLTISLFGLDAGYWAGNYGPLFTNASLSTPGGSSGASATSGTTTFTVVVTDANGLTSTKTLTFAVASDIAITTKTLGNGNKSSSYTQSLNATGGSGTLTWALVTGSLPAGLSLASNGTISGTVSSSATSQTFTVGVTDANSATVSQQYTITVLSGVPGAPTSLSLGTPGNGSLPLTWTAPTDNGGSAITNYIVSYLSAKGKGDDDEEGEEDKGSISVSATGLTMPYSLTGLKNGRTYTITVAAKNSSATSVASNSVTGTPAKAAGAPQQLSMILANGGISIRWKKPSESGGLKVGSYEVQCRNSSTTDTDSNWKTITNRQDTNSENVISTILDATSTEITLTKGDSYLCRVRVKSSIGSTNYSGTWATTSSALSFSSVPSAPSITTIDTTTATTKVTVTFNKSSDDGGSDISSYLASVVKKKDNGEDEDDKRTCNVNKPAGGWTATSYNCTINSVPTKGTFTVEVKAINSVGQSVGDTETVRIAGKTQVLTYPNSSSSYNTGTRTYTKTIGDADFSIGVTSNSGLKLKYTISSGDQEKCTITGKGLIKVKKVGTCTITITQNGKAGDDDDEDKNTTDSDWEPITGTSEYVVVNIQGARPSAPSWKSVTVGDSSLALEWNAPRAPNDTVTDYKIEYSSNSGSTWSTFSHGDTSKTRTITGLTNGTAYVVRISSNNAGSFSSAVQMSGSFTPAAVPTKPTISSVTAYPDTSTVTVSWSAATANGSAVLGYTVTGTATSQSNVTCTVGGSTTSCNITGLKNKNTYSFTLVARNAIGNSAASDAVTSAIDGVSQTISATDPASTGWAVGDPDLQLTASASSGLPIQYSTTTSSYCTVSTGGLVHFVSNGTCKIYLDQNGTNSSTSGGDNTKPTKYSAATQYGPIELVISPAKPSAPVITSITNSSSGLTVNWNAPTKGGGTMSYVVTGTNGSTTVNCSVSALTCLITPTGYKGIEFSFSAVANNGVDSSTASAVVKATWRTLPSAPNSSSTTSVASSTDGRALNVYWNKSTDDGGSAITSYTATAGSQSCSVLRDDSKDSSGYSCTISGLTADTDYSVTVIATNSIGNSTALSIGTLRPGLTQTISLNSPTAATMSKTYGDSDFQISASVTSGATLSYSKSGSGCTISSTGMVHIEAVDTCIITISQAGGGNTQYKAATSVTVTVTIGYATPSSPVFTKASPASQSILAQWTAPTFNGGGSLTYSVSATSSDGGASGSCSTSSTSCTISGLTDGKNYTVTVTATNSGNLTSAATTWVSLISPYTNAQAPLPLAVVGGIRSAAVSYSAPTVYNNALHHYTVYYRVKGTSGDGTLGFDTVNETATVSGTISSLSNDTEYEFRAAAWTIDTATVGAVPQIGTFTNWVTAKTLAAPGAPTNVNGSSTYVSGSSTAAISWTPPSNNGGSAITGYTASVTPSGGGSASTCTTTSTTCSISGLTAGATYSVTVVAGNAVDTGTASAAITITLVAPAGAPTITAATADNATGIVAVTWSAPASTGGSNITSYTVTAYTSDGNSTSYGCTVAVNTAPAPATSTCDVSGLPYKTVYKFKVAAVTSAGTGTYSDFSSTITLELNQTINFPTISAKDFNTVNTTALATATSGLTITYTSNDTLVCTVSGAVITFVKIGTCSVTAAQGGNSTYNAATSVTNTFAINAVTPSPITLMQVAPGASKLTVTWSQATDLGGSTLKHYILSWAKQTDFSDEQTITTSSYQNVEISGLDANTAYIVRVAVATNDASDASDWSNRLSATTYGAPSAPTGVTASSSSPGLATVTWTDSSSNGGTPITGYTAEAYDNTSNLATGLTCTATAGATGCSISGLNGATYYVVKVTATNAVGSATSDPSGTAFRPGISQTVSLSDLPTDHLAGSIQLTGSATSGLPVTYRLISEESANATSSSWGSGRNVCSVTSAGVLTVDLGGTCVIGVNQNGNDGSGNATSYLSADEETATVTVAVTVPSLVGTFTLTAGNEKIRVDWTAPDDDGGAPILDYILTWYESGTRPTQVAAGGATTVSVAGNAYGRRTVAATEITDVISELENGTTYTVIIQARNSAGLGPES